MSRNYSCVEECAVSRGTLSSSCSYISLSFHRDYLDCRHKDFEEAHESRSSDYRIASCATSEYKFQVS
jgi:hypothetical protein